MATRNAQVFNIHAGAAFLEVLADAVLKGFPLANASNPLSDWTILLPTRRAARAFSEILLKQSGKKALILPRIKPIGDLDEDLLQDELVSDLAKPMSDIAHIVEITRLTKDWAHQNQHISLAREILVSPAQAVNLAQSLIEIIITAETHQLAVHDLTQLYDIDIAEHRQTITSLLELVLKDLPARQDEEGLMGATARRSAMIRAEAKRIAEGRHFGPIIAAGSTGAIPATRELLSAIALHAEGAVILPGLDTYADELSWGCITPEHPQFGLKTLLEEFGLERHQVQNLGSSLNPRNRLTSEVFRPTETTPLWHQRLPAQREDLSLAVQGLTEIACPDRHLEARVIATILRETLTHQGKTAALVTPDRDLANRVVAEMERWGISVFDSAGAPLTRRGLGAALDLLLQAQLGGFAPVKFFAFLRHPLVTLDLDSATYARVLHNFELTVLRGSFVLADSYAQTLHQTRIAAASNTHLNPIIKRFTEVEWHELLVFAQALDKFLGLFNPALTGLTPRLSEIETALRFACVPEAWVEAEAPVLELLDELKTEGKRLQDATMVETATLLRQLLQQEKQQPLTAGHPRLAILGTLEARLLPFDVIILGGLNETIWPKSADPGPWLNRTMRQRLNLPLPERALGMAAHDFEQGFTNRQVYLTWSKRLNNAPQSPSRWLLRLGAVLATAGVAAPDGGQWLAHAQSLSYAAVSNAVQKPAFAPSVAARPVKFSVTEVEKLIRNPYAIYAKRILKLEPLLDFAQRPDQRMRGTLFHEAIGKWNAQASPSLAALMAEGEKVLDSLGGNAEQRHFWAPHFKRLAIFLWAEQTALRENLLHTHAECGGELKFNFEDVDYILTARADRIDILSNAGSRVIDYKTGAIPSVDQVKANFSPQLTLQAAMLLGGAFKFTPKSVDELIYFKIGGGRDGLKKSFAVNEASVEIAALAGKHLARFKALLAIYQDVTQTYLPRVSVEKEDDAQDYDHLSRYLEWQLAGQKT